MTDNYTVSRRHDWQLPVFALVLVCSVVGCAWFSIIVTPDKTAAKLSITPHLIDTTSQEDPAPVGMIVAAGIGQSLTPFQPVANTPLPTQTPLPTSTPYPTFTHTAMQLVSDNVQIEPIIVYETHMITQIVTVEVEVEILITPHATPTPQPTPDYRATQNALTTAAAKRAGQWETIAIWTVAFTISVLAGIVLVVIVRAMWEWLTSPKIQVEQTREEILAPEMSPVDGLPMEQYQFVKRMLIHKTNGVPTYSKSEIERQYTERYRSKSYTGGGAARVVNEVEAHLESVP